jgi:hypothetical protein
VILGFVLICTEVRVLNGRILVLASGRWAGPDILWPCGLRRVSAFATTRTLAVWEIQCVLVGAWSPISLAARAGSGTSCGECAQLVGVEAVTLPCTRGVAHKALCAGGCAGRRGAPAPRQEGVVVVRLVRALRRPEEELWTTADSGPCRGTRRQMERSRLCDFVDCGS